MLSELSNDIFNIKVIQSFTQWYVFKWTVHLRLRPALSEQMGNAGQNSVFVSFLDTIFHFQY
jgi:hypothetical protein